jgi:hypothetical protein
MIETMAQQQPAIGGHMAGMDACLSFDSQDTARVSAPSALLSPCSIGSSLSFDYIDGGVEPEFDVLSFTLDSFIGYLVEDMSRLHNFATFINERPIFYDRLNTNV